ncbi:hypothetical protein [Mycoplasmopsis gallopavonis]|uniref:Uncharacterized protein n=1 Tax=Mycoplasmopsis gallopavonis TaxID=76629 RepID=A0A449B025_9BACT|nr:hypothetical protein [Mycoplasmopsis gallopavonis]RIV16847.1 hypothetical protein D1113_00700 [Mycoplasmopsis gallopavonis]VEU73151.1 Uncharacterised protein [Mycoplasmopsis gallopavonis]
MPNDTRVADIERVKLLAEELLIAKQKVKEINQMLKDLVRDTEIEFSEPLSDGGWVTYELVEAKPRIDYRKYSQYLFNLLNRGEKLTEEEMQVVIESFVVTKDPKWSLKIKK